MAREQGHRNSCSGICSVRPTLSIGGGQARTTLAHEKQKEGDFSPSLVPYEQPYCLAGVSAGLGVVFIFAVLTTL
jgi:hypothetical protein